MRLWSLHPGLLDAKGLVALWREGLLAHAVLNGRARGYSHHPQLERFRNHPRPLAAIKAYLHLVCDEADGRSYRFDRSKLGRRAPASRIPVTMGQLEYELEHLRRKLRVRDPARFNRLRKIRKPECHPMFRIVSGGIAPWERT